MSKTTDAFVEQNRDRLLDELKEFLRIPSISTLPEHRGDIDRAAEFVANSLRNVGMENVEIVPTAKHPLVYADWMHAPGKPTVLCYGHYDVQPADPLEEWNSPPFEPEVRDGNIYGRGTADDKGQMYMHVKAIEALRTADGTLPINVKFLVEGEEEVGGESIAKYVAENPEKLKADVALVSDTELFADGIPTCASACADWSIWKWNPPGPARDLHSGLYGGAAPNPIFGLVELLSKVKNANGVIQVPGIYDDVEPPAPAEKRSWKRLPFSEEEFRLKEVGSSELTGEKKPSVLERVWARPTFEVHGIAGGFTGAGAKTVIPAKATAKVSIRLVPKQDPEKVVAAFREFVEKHTPKGIHFEVRVLSAGPGLSVNPDHPAIKWPPRRSATFWARRPFSSAPADRFPSWATSPTHLGIPTVLMGFGLPDDGLHSPNEKYVWKITTTASRPSRTSSSSTARRPCKWHSARSTSCSSTPASSSSSPSSNGTRPRSTGFLAINVKGPYFLVQALLPIFANPASIVIDESA
jgi:acetylornithine deacetylase/succinyl-diaminopimelate desuccinylase-like protein